MTKILLLAVAILVGCGDGKSTPTAPPTPAAKILSFVSDKNSSSTFDFFYDYNFRFHLVIQETGQGSATLDSVAVLFFTPDSFIREVESYSIKASDLRPYSDIGAGSYTLAIFTAMFNAPNATGYAIELKLTDKKDSRRFTSRIPSVGDDPLPERTF